MKHKNTIRIKNYVLILSSLFLLMTGQLQAAVSILKATGGTNITADKAANAVSPAYTSLGIVRLTEVAVADFSAGVNVTLTLNAPAGWEYNTSAAVTANATAARDITSPSVLSISTSVITVQFTVGGITKLDVLSVSGIQVRAMEGADITAAVTITSGGTAVIAGCAIGSSLGNLSQIAGASSKLIVTLPGQVYTDASTAAASGNSGTAANQSSGTSFIIANIRATDQFKNVKTTYSGAKTISYSGPSNGLTAPNYTTAVSFISGVSTTALTTTLKKAETITITATDGSISGLASSSFTVDPGLLNNFTVTNTLGGIIGAQSSASPFNIKITGRDAENNTCSSGPNNFTGTVDITSTGTLSSGGGTTAAFTAGVLASASVTISNTGTFTITATKTGGGASGISNSFLVGGGVLNNFLVEATPSGNIGSQAAGTAFTIKITARDAGNNICSSFTGTVDITSTGTLSAGSGTTPAFTAGVLSSRSVAISNTGTFTITATLTGGGSSGNSNSFIVGGGVLNNFLVEAAAGGNIGSQTAGTSFNIKISARDINNNILNSGPNIFTGTVDLTSTGILSAGGGTTPAFTAGVLASRSMAITNTGSFTITAVKTGSSENGISNSFIVDAGALNNFLVEASTGGNIATQSTGIPFNIKITARDANNNTLSSGPNAFNGTADITSTGTLSGGGGTTPAFTGGVFASRSVTISNVGTFTITATKTGSIENGTSNSFNVTASTLHHFLVEDVSGGNIGTQGVGVSFNVKITARDINNNILSAGPNVFNGTVDITSTGTLSAGSGTTPAFTAGVLASRAVTISNIGTFTITATKTGNVETGTSNSFIVSNPIPTASNISPSCIDIGGSGFVLTVNGTNYNSSSIVKFNGTNKPTSLINSTQLQATINASDIAVAGVFLITVFNPAPGGGTSSSITLKANSLSSANVSICQGSTYILPDGIPKNTAGTYISHISNAAGCDSAITTVLTVNSNPTLTAAANQIACFGGTGSVTLSTTGGLAPYTYGPQSTINLAQGTYTFTVMDANGCVDSKNATINPAPSLLTLSATPTQIVCFNGTGSVVLNAGGGSLPYNYGGSAVSNLSPGTYNYIVTDNNGCNANASAVINAAPSAISSTITANSIPCGQSTGNISVNVSGGVSPYSYLWNTSPAQNTSAASGLQAGTYTVTITDNVGCTSTNSGTVTNLNPPNCVITGTTSICAGGSTTLCAPGGMASYLWSTGAVTSCITVNSPGTYTVTISTALGCMNSNSATVLVGSAPPSSISGNGIFCTGSTLVLRAPTGQAGYLWSNGSTGNAISITSGGVYTVTVSGSGGCTSSSSTTVISPLHLSVSQTNGVCSNGFTGSASANATLGVQPYSYLWSTGATTDSIKGMSAGPYNVRVSDANGCIATYSSVIVVTKTAGDYSFNPDIFNNNIINANSYIWFSCLVKVTYTGTYPVTIKFTNQNIASSRFNVNPVNGKLILTNAVTQATTVYTAGEWVTTAPPNLAGEYFVSGIPFKATTSIPANLTPVTWKGIWSANSACVTNIEWKWGAAVYSSFTTLLTGINIKSVDGNVNSPYNNTDPAGTPEDYKAFCIAGGRSVGGTDYAGVLSIFVNRAPCAPVINCSGPAPKLFDEDNLAAKTSDDEDFYFRAYPNPFSSITTIEFERKDKSDKVAIDIYSVYGRKIRTIFDSDIVQNEKYLVEFNASDLAEGIYIFRITGTDKTKTGKLVLKK